MSFLRRYRCQEQRQKKTHNYSSIHSFSVDERLETSETGPVTRSQSLFNRVLLWLVSKRKEDTKGTRLCSPLCSSLTSRWMKFLAILLTPSHVEYKRWISTGPEVVTLRPAIKVKPQTRSFHSDYGTNTNVWRMLRVNGLQFHVLLESRRQFTLQIQKWILLQWCKKKTILSFLSHFSWRHSKKTALCKPWANATS